MDAALLRDRENFKKRALALPTVEKRKAQSNESSKPAKKAKPSKPSSSSSTSAFDYKTNTGSSQYRFSILAKLVKHLKQRHMDGFSHSLKIDELLDETNQTDIPQRHKHWLVTEALLNNPKIEVVNNDEYKFKPKYQIKDRKGLLRLLDKHDQKGQGGILMEDVEESLPNSAKAFRILGDQITYVTRTTDKKKVLFYNDKSCSFKVEEDLQKLWRGATVEGTDETKIEEYLARQGITAVPDMALRKPLPAQKRKGGKKKGIGKFKTHNEHMGNILQDYSDVKK